MSWRSNPRTRSWPISTGRRLIPVSVREKEAGISFTFGTGIKTRDIVIFTRQFATMINSGLPLVQSLDILAEQTENQYLQEGDPGCSLRRRVRAHAGRRHGETPEGLHRAVREHGGCR